MRLKAEFFGNCYLCGFRIRPGDMIEFTPGEDSVHGLCADGDDPGDTDDSEFDYPMRDWGDL